MAVDKIDDLSSIKDKIEALVVELHIIITTTHVYASYMSKRQSMLVLFINNRLVSSN